jgi:hypothetical protein
MASHPEIQDKKLRKIMANELWLMRKQKKRILASGVTPDFFFGVKVGFETAIRRVEYMARVQA